MRAQRAEEAAAKTPQPLQALAFPSSERLDGLRRSLSRASGPSSIVTIGDQSYRGFDNGRANVLVPIDDPLVSPTELAERRRAVERVRFMTEHPFGAAAYGFATLLGASSRARDGALAAGGFADAAMLAAAPRGAPVRGRVTPPQGPPDAPTLRRPNIRLGGLNANAQATGVSATLTAPMLDTGTRANWRRRPPGWQGNGKRYNEARGHLLGKQLGGSGSDMRNLVTLTHRGANTPQMKGFEDGLARRVRAGEVVEYFVQPLYGSGALPPSAILLTAHGTRAAPSARIIHNPAGRPR